MTNKFNTEPYKSLISKKEKIINYYKNHTRKETAQKFNVSDWEMKSFLTKIGYKKSKEEICLTKKQGAETRATNLYAKYGVYNITQLPETMEKIRQTCLKKYGGTNPMSSPKTMEKREQTCLERYGVTNVFQHQEVKNKIKEYNIKHYGVENPCQRQEIKDKIKNTNLEMYGNENLFLSETFKNKMIQKYGVPYFCMTYECRKHSKNNSKPNMKFELWLKEKNIEFEREFTLENYSYDFRIQNFLIEINPYATHNSTWGIYSPDGLKKDYHLNKSKIASKYGYNCIHLFDWDNKDIILEIIQGILPQSCIIKQEINCIYCDNSKISEKFMENLGYKLVKHFPPQVHWYNFKTKEHIILQKEVTIQETKENLKNWVEIYDSGLSKYSKKTEEFEW